ncbi:MAG: 50S ribosomal protein L21 [Candidatus Pacebacteria bacterium]|nr:50S ribosomal protein L21 [Candidatus Paceibacterota bacterium]MBP9780418.1 50S ribosomal protein L21 [Candidatus Paceibacterota bacterium]
MAKVAKKDEFAVFFTGGKQYKVSVGDVLKIEKLDGEHKAGDVLSFDKVLLVDNGTDTSIGTPYIAGAQVTATLKKIDRYPTVRVVRYKQKSRYHKENGHRQPYAEIEITGIK